MAKKIFVCEEDIESILAEAKEQLLRGKHFNGVTIKQSLKSDNRNAWLCFTPTAWVKMTTLVSGFTTEVQWHGLVRRVSVNEFQIYDIIVPPHTVSATTVVSDQEKYTEWINALDDDTFNTLRFHGHSHVDMPVSPSATDTGYRENIVRQMPRPAEGDDSFYIFMIINKRLEWSAEIYDLTNNALYSTVAKEIDLDVTLDDGTDIDTFLFDARKRAVKEAPVYQSYSSYGKGSYYGGKGNSYGGKSASNYDKPSAVVVTQPAKSAIQTQPASSATPTQPSKGATSTQPTQGSTPSASLPSIPNAYGGYDYFDEYEGYDPEDVSDPFYYSENGRWH